MFSMFSIKKFPDEYVLSRKYLQNQEFIGRQLKASEYMRTTEEIVKNIEKLRKDQD